MKNIRTFLYGIIFGITALIVMAYYMNNNKCCIKKKAGKTIDMAEGMLSNMKNMVNKC